jgi:tetratricopeptide (TPR) repeat protein
MEPAGLKRAIQVYEKAFAATPDNAMLCPSLATMKMAAGDVAGIEEAARRETELLPSDPGGWDVMGMVLVNQRRLEDAAAAYSHQLELSPNDPRALLNHGNVLGLLGRTDEAIREYRRALQAQPSYSRAWINLGQTYANTGRTAEAEGCYQQALLNNIDPAQAPLMAQFCRSRGWFEAAATNYEEAITLDPMSPNLRTEAGINLLQMQRYAPAEDEFREALRLNPESTQPHMGLGVALLREGHRLEAATQFDEVLRRDPNNALALKFAEESREPLDAGKAR